MRRFLLSLVLGSAAFSLACNLLTTAVEQATPTSPPAVTAAPPEATAAPPTVTAPTPTSPPPAPEANETPSLLPGPAIAYDIVRFSVPAEIASGVSARLAPASDTGEDMPYWGIHPAYVEAGLVDYARADTFHQPRVEVYPITEYEAVNPDVGRVIGRLQELLTQKPAEPEDIPFLPTFNAAQVLRAQVKYLDFHNGSGVRFLTLYAQYFAPINNHDLFYTFQGVTGDGAHYVTVILPVSAPFLADTSDPAAVVPSDGVPFPDVNAADFETQYQDYLNAVTARLNELPAAGFTPGLDALDALAASIQID